MALKYCPNCRRVLEVKVLPDGYSQENFRGILAKRRQLIHLGEDGGCGCEWATLELPEDVIMGLGDQRTHR